MKKEKKLRIAFVTNNYIPYSGGVVSSINAFAQQLMECGHEVLIIALDFLGDQHDDPPYVVRVPSLFCFTYYANPLCVPWRPDAQVLQILKKFNPDVVHAHHPFLLGQSALQAARELRVPIVFTYHTMYELYTHYVPLYQPLVKLAVKKKVARFCEDVDHIIAPSSAVRNLLTNQTIKTPVTIIPSPLRPEFFDSSQSSEDKKKSVFRLLLVSRLVKEKNVSFVLDVFCKLDPKRFALTIVGYGDEQEALREYAYKKLKLSDKQVDFVIKPPKSELIRLYREADLFLFPSTTDTQGIVLAEAMAGGTPVVAVDGPGQRDIVRNGENGFIVESAGQMIEKIKQIVNDDDLLVNLQRGALATAQQYRPEALTEQLMHLYESLIKS